MSRKEEIENLLREMSLAELRPLLKKRISREAKRLERLRAKKERLVSDLEDITREIDSIESVIPGSTGSACAPVRVSPRSPIESLGPGGSTSKKGQRVRRGRRKGGVTLKQAIHDILAAAGRPLAVSEIRERLLESKVLPSISKTFAQQVANTLSRNKEFKRNESGGYSL